MIISHDKKKNDISQRLTLYLVSDRSWLNDGETLESVVEEAIRGGVTAFQIREKNLSRDEYIERARAIKKIADTYNILFIVNDDVDVALEVGADGVHLGADDMTVSEVRRRVPKDFIIGASARNVDIAKKAEADGADYLGVGAVFGTTTKSDAKTINVDILKSIAESVNIPIVAIGGVNENNVTLLKGSGIAGTAVVSCILKADDKRKKAEDMLRLVKEVKNG